MRMQALVVAAAMVVAVAGTAMAQSHQGGYLGLNPGGHLLQSQVPPPSEFGSGQGGYLGKDPGAHLATPTEAPPPEFGSGEGGYLGMVPGAVPGSNRDQAAASTAHQLAQARRGQ